MTPDAEYWQGRFTQLENANHRAAEAVADDLDRAYRAATREIEGQLSTWYGRFANNNGIVDMAEARRLLNSSELAEFKWTVSEYAQHARDNGNGQWQKQLENASARWHVSRLQALQVQMQNTVEVLYGNQLDRVDVLAKETFLQSYLHTAYEIQKGVGVGWDIAGLNQNAIQVAVLKPWSLDGRNFSDRIWSNKETLIRELQTQLTQNLLVGGDLNRVVEAIQKKMGTSRYNAARLVYTENAYVQAVAQGESYRATGVKQFRFVATLDDRTSDICREMDGQVFDMKDYQPGVNVPPLHPWCRSCTCPHYADLAGIGERAARDPDTGKTYYVPREMTYHQWEDTFVTDPDTGESGSKKGLLEAAVGATLKLDDCKTVEEVENWMRSHDWFRPDSTGTGKFDLSLSGCDLECAKEIARAYEEVFTEFPFLVKNIDAVRAVALQPGTYAQCYTIGSGRVEVSTRLFKDAANLAKMYQRDLLSHFHPEGTDWKSIVTHELGHALDGYLTVQGLGGAKNSWSYKDVSAMMRPKVMKACGLKVSDTAREVSGYATKNAREWFAECFAEAMKSATPRRVATEFMKQLREIVKGVVLK